MAARDNHYRILSIDGGGLRGVIPLVILGRLDEAVPGWRDQINMFSGTSTGGLIALGLASGKTPKQLLDIYMAKGGLIFERHFWHEVRDLQEVRGPKYGSANREEVCKEILGDTVTLGELTGRDGALKHVVVTAFDLDDKTDPDPRTRRWKAKIFHNVPTTNDSGDEHEYAYRVAMRTSAAPTYFGSFDGYVDCGVIANNPSMCALAQTQDRRLKKPIELGAVRMLSLGTGSHPYHLSGDENWGLAQWAPHLVGLLMEGVTEIAHFQTEQMMPTGAYRRIAVHLQREIAMDNASQLGVLQRIGDAVSGKTVADAATFLQEW